MEDIAVSGDYTFTAPSMYIVMSSGIHVTDNCGTIGASMHSAVVPVSVGALKSVSYNIRVGQTLTDAVATAVSFTKPVRPEDLACPTWGISGNWNPRPNADPLEIPGGIDLDIPSAQPIGATSLAIISVVKDDTVVGAPWYPILVLPHEVLGLDPSWQACVGRLLNPSFPIFDPPHALQGQTEIVSLSGPANPLAEVTPAPPGANVHLPGSQLLQPSPLGLAPAATTNAAPLTTVSAEADTDPQSTPDLPAVSLPAGKPGFMNSLSAALAVSTVNVVPDATNLPVPSGQNLPPTEAVHPSAPNDPIPLSVAGQQVQQAGSTLVVGGQSIAPGSTGSVAGHQVVNNGNHVVVDGSSQMIQPGPSPTPAALPSVGGQQIQQFGSNLVVAGQTIAPDSTGSVAGHAVVNKGSNVVIDGSPQAIQPIPTPTAAALPSVGGQQIQQAGSNLVVAGQTIAPGSTGSVGGHAVVNNGKDVVIDGSSHPVQPVQPAPTPVFVGGKPGDEDATGVAPAFQGERSDFAALPLTSVGDQQIQQQGQPPLTIDGSTYLPTGASSAYILPGDQTLIPGAQVTVGGVPVSLAHDGGAAVVGSSTEYLAPSITPPPGLPAIFFAGSTFRPLGASSAYIINGQTLTPGASAITVSGTPVSLYANGATAVIGSSTEVLQPPIASAPGLTFDGTTYQATNVGGLSSAYVIQGQTITPGAGPVTISGTPISVAPNGNNAVVGGVTEQLVASGQVPEPALTFDGSIIHPVTGTPSNYVINGQTLTPGGQITVSGTPISLATNAASAVIGTSTENLQMTEPPLVVGGSTFYPTGPSSAYVVDGQTLTRGASLTISGTPISLASDGASAVVGSSTENLMPSLTSGAVLTVGGQTFTPNPSSFVLDGKTMTVGGSAIISGTPVELEPSGTLMVGTSEIPLATSSGNFVAPSNDPLTGSAIDRRRNLWPGAIMGLIGPCLLYIV